MSESIRASENMLKNKDLLLKPIAYVANGYQEKFGTPRQSGLIEEMRCEIIFEPWVYAEKALQGLEDFSHVWLLWWFHQNTNERYLPIIKPPRLNGEKKGVFATRSPHRPNPVGLSLVRLLATSKTSLICAGADLIQGTPIIDIKPYLPEVEALPEARGGWTTKTPQFPVQVGWSELALEKLNLLTDLPTDFRTIIEKMIAGDPRPKVYKNNYEFMHGIRIYNVDVRFQFLNDTQAVIVDVV
ncbi:MAG: tRNA (N6-threonylcarbamoyladenosine(37)-N6)-methyltransferase TrmO [Pseudobdellovibrionaceae bacterium]